MEFYEESYLIQIFLISSQGYFLKKDLVNIV